MKHLEKIFAPHELALLAKKFGFDDECLGEYFTDGVLTLTVGKESFLQAVELNKVLSCKAPTYTQIIDWLGAYHYIYITDEFQSLGSDEWCFGYSISWLPKEHQDEKRRFPHFKSKDSFSISGGATYSGGWDTQLEAISNGIKQAFKILESQPPPTT